MPKRQLLSRINFGYPTYHRMSPRNVRYISLPKYMNYPLSPFHTGLEIPSLAALSNNNLCSEGLSCQTCGYLSLTVFLLAGWWRSAGLPRCRLRAVWSACSLASHTVFLALVPGLPRFDLPFVFTIIHGIARSTKIKTGKAWEHSSCEWTQGGRRGGGADIQIYTY